MSLVTLADAKAHLRIEEAGEDTLIQAYVNAAELLATNYIGCNVYADQSALDSARASASASVSEAVAKYEADTASAMSKPSETEVEYWAQHAHRTYTTSIGAASRALEGIVLNDAIKSAILLIVGHLYLNREAGTDKAISEIPFGVYALLQPFRVY